MADTDAAPSLTRIFENLRNVMLSLPDPTRMRDSDMPAFTAALEEATRLDTEHTATDKEAGPSAISSNDSARPRGLEGVTLIKAKTYEVAGGNGFILASMVSSAVPGNLLG